MAGSGKSSSEGAALADRVGDIARSLGVDARREVRAGRSAWGAARRIDLVVSDKSTRKSLGIECKYQRTLGTAEQKTLATIKDMEAWPIAGLLVFDGPGFTANIKGYLYSTGKAAAVEDLEAWLELYFGL